jgi:hypothetical protein
MSSAPPDPSENTGKPPMLPRWVATRGPRPYFIAEHWSLILAVLTALAVFLNTIVVVPGISVTSEKWINAGLAWVAALGLYLKGRQDHINAIAAWRAEVRAQEAEERLAEESGEVTTPLPYRVHQVDDRAGETAAENEDE